MLAAARNTFCHYVINNYLIINYVMTEEERIRRCWERKRVAYGGRDYTAATRLYTVSLSTASKPARSIIEMISCFDIFTSLFDSTE